MISVNNQQHLRLSYMSKPSSNLSNFRSYSYYHIVAMCDSTETAEQLVSQPFDTTDVWLHATYATTDETANIGWSKLGKFAPKKTKTGRYCILINGSTDATYVLNSIQWSTTTAASAVTGDKGTSIAVEGSMSVTEPKGISFLDTIVNCGVSLGVDSSQSIFVIKTVFVGYTMEGTVSIISDIPPLMALIYDVTGSFKESGGFYDLQFVSINHGAARLPQYSKIGTAINLTAGSTLEQTINKLQTVVNDSYAQYFDCVYKSITQHQSDADVELLKRSLRKVSYVIQVAPRYKDGQSPVKYTVTNQPNQYKNSNSCSASSQITIPANSSIEQAIQTIMMSSSQVQDDMTKGDPTDHMKYEFKIHSSVISEKTSDGLIDYKVVYSIEPFLSPKSLVASDMFSVLAQDQTQLEKDPQYARIKDNVIEFDYLYTGNNIDVLEFDMKVNLGLAYIQTATLANSLRNQRMSSSSVVTQPSSMGIQQIGRFTGELVQVPIYFGTQIKSPSLFGSQNQSNAIQSAYTLNAHASLEVAETEMVILGNDILLGSSSQLNIPSSVVNRTDRPIGTNSMSQWGLIPAYAKVNIKMPNSNDDIDLFTGKVGDYASTFWFDGYYYVYGIDHIFNEGTFTQKLHMIAIIRKSTGDALKQKNTPIDVMSTVGSCLNQAEGCAGKPTTTSSQPSNTVPHTPANGTTPTTKNDADSASAQTIDLSNVIGWDNAKPSVRVAIEDAANKYQVNPVTLAQMVAHESRFNPTAQPYNSKTNKYLSSAAGLGQFLKDTWNGLIKQGKIDGLNTSNGLVTTDGPKASSDDIRFNPKYNAYATAVYIKDNTKALGTTDVGDLYLAHFIGPGSASKIIKACSDGVGNLPLYDTMGAGWTSDKKAANPGVPFTSATALRTWAATIMASTLKHPTKVAVSSNTLAATPVSPKASTAIANTNDCAVQKANETKPTDCK